MLDTNKLFLSEILTKCLQTRPTILLKMLEQYGEVSALHSADYAPMDMVRIFEMAHNHFEDMNEAEAFEHAKSQRSLIAKLLMKFFHIKNINEYENLTPSCSKCNSKKGSKIAVKYLYNGVTGKIGSGIVVRRIVKLLIFLSIICLIFMLSQILSNYISLK